MKDIVFMDIDTQFDFMSPQGALYVKDANSLIPNLKTLTHFALNNDILIIATADNHKKNDPEFKQFPPHCVRGTQGAKKISQTLLKKHIIMPLGILTKRQLFNRIKCHKQVIFNKDTYDSFMDLNIMRALKPFKAVFVYGVALDYCVKCAILGLVQAGLEVNLVIDATQAIDTKAGQALLDSFKKIGVRLVKTKDVLSNAW